MKRSQSKYWFGMAVDEDRLPNFLTPRDCPQVAYHVDQQTNDADKKRYFSSSGISHAIIVESKWYHTMKNTTLYLYEFHTENFVLQDSIAGYYIAITQHPKGKYILTDLFGELLRRNMEIRITDSLWDIADDVKTSTLNWSLCRMAKISPHP